jgi:sec-independent protein translocase protein TatA
MTLSSSPILGSFLGLGGPELLIVLAVLILLFGAKKLPELAKGMGQSIKEFKKASKENEATAEPSEADLKAELAAAKAELAASKAAKRDDSAKTHGSN